MSSFSRSLENLTESDVRPFVGSAVTETTKTQRLLKESKAFCCQFHIISEIGRDSLRRSKYTIPTTVPQLPLEPAQFKAKSSKPHTSKSDCHIQLIFEHLQRWRYNNLSGKYVPVVVQPHTCKISLLMIQWNFLCFNLCTMLCALSLGTTEKSVPPPSLLPSTRHLYTLIRSPFPWAFSSPGQTVPAFSAFSPVRDDPVP